MLAGRSLAADRTVRLGRTAQEHHIGLVGHTVDLDRTAAGHTELPDRIVGRIVVRIAGQTAGQTAGRIADRIAGRTAARIDPAARIGLGCSLRRIQT